MTYDFTLSESISDMSFSVSYNKNVVELTFYIHEIFTLCGVEFFSLWDSGTRLKRCFTMVVNSSEDMNPFLSQSKIL